MLDSEKVGEQFADIHRLRQRVADLKPEAEAVLARRAGATHGPRGDVLTVLEYENARKALRAACLELAEV